MSLGQRVRNRRLELKLTQQQLAKALDLTSQHISVIEQDKRTPSLASLAKMAEELGVSVDYLITGRKSIITDTIPAIRADNKLKLPIKKALITLVQALHDEE